jgi:hypothetical protein
LVLSLLLHNLPDCEACCIWLVQVNLSCLQDMDMDSPAQHSTSGKNTALVVLSCCFFLTAIPHSKACFSGRKT